MSAPSLSFPDDQQLFTALGSEALILQNKRSALTNEATNRSSLFVAIVSGSLVAAGFVLRTTYAFSFLTIVLPVVLLLGTVTFFRLATIARDDRRLDGQLERIRDGFRQLSPRGPDYLLHPAQSRPGPHRTWHTIGTVVTSAAGFIGLLDAAILGLGVTLLVGVATASPASPAIIAGGVLSSVVALLAVIAWLLRATTAGWRGPRGTPAAVPSSPGR